MNEGDDAEWLGIKQVQDLLVVLELKLPPPDALLVVLGLHRRSCDVMEGHLMPYNSISVRLSLGLDAFR